MITGLPAAKLPEAPRHSEYNAAVNEMHKPAEGMPDFKTLMAASNDLRMKEIEAEKAQSADGQLSIGESKSDKEFRQMLEKATGKKQDRLKNKLEKDDYLSLLVTQLKHQDPLKPMENQEMAMQMAQLNTVEQLISMNKTLNEMAQSQKAADIDKMTPLLDKNVMVMGDRIRMNADKTISQGGFELKGAAQTVTITIKDEADKLVRTITQSEMPAGQHKIEWDGKNNAGEPVAPGQYKIGIVAASDKGVPVEAKTHFEAKVNGVTDLRTGGKLQTTAGLVDLKDVISVKNSSKDDEKASKPASVAATTQPSSVASNPTAATPPTTAAPASTPAPTASVTAPAATPTTAPAATSAMNAAPTAERAVAPAAATTPKPAASAANNSSATKNA